MRTTNPILRAGWKLRLASPPPAHLPLPDLGPAAMVTVAGPVQTILPFALDQSYWDPTDYAAVNPLPSLVYLRASAGAGYRDTRFLTHVAGWRTRNVPLTAYHFFKYNESWRQQADIFKSQIARAGGTSILSYPVVLDIEGYLPTGMGPSLAQGLLWNWVNAMNYELGVGVWVYSSAHYLNQLRVNGVLPRWMTLPDSVTGQSRRFAIAGYPPDPNLVQTMPIYYWPVGLNYENQDWLWQDTEKYYLQGVQGAQDRNRILESVPPSGAQPPSQVVLRYLVIASWLNIRSGPGTSYTILWTAPYGTILEAYGNAPVQNGFIQLIDGSWASKTYLQAV